MVVVTQRMDVVLFHEYNSFRITATTCCLNTEITTELPIYSVPDDPQTDECVFPSCITESLQSLELVASGEYQTDCDQVIRKVQLTSTTSL